MIELDSLHSSKTYGGVYEGCPTPEEMIKSAEKRAERVFGKRKTFVIEPVITDGKLPPCCHILWLSSHTPIPAKEEGEEEGHGSQLVVIYYNNTVQSDHSMIVKTFNENVEEWNNLAENFWY